MVSQIISIAIAVLAGLSVGSFLAVIVVRWPNGLSIVWGRSKCDICAATISLYRMIPLLSYALQKGRCSSCRGRIDPIHWKMELSSAIIAGSAFAFTPFWEAVVWCLLGWQLLLLAVIDFRHFWLPDRLTFVLAATGLALAYVLPVSGMFWDRAIGGVAGFLVLWVIALTYRRLSKRDGLGTGDPKILGALGCWIGWQALPVLVLLSAILGLLLAFIYSLSGQKVSGDTPLPLGTLFAISAVPTMLIEQVL